MYQYEDLATTAKQAGGYVGRSATTWMCNRYGEIAKWGEQKSDQLYNMVDFYEREAAKASNQLYEIIRFSCIMYEII